MDIVKRLREEQVVCLRAGPEDVAYLVGEAADTIEALCEALQSIEKRCADYERISLVGKTQAAKKAGTLRNVLTEARAALAKAGVQ